jgi:hypothetical protein
MPHSRLLVLPCLALLITFFASRAFAQQGAEPEGGPDLSKPEFSLGIGYSSISISSGSTIHDEGAVHFDPSVSISPLHQLPQLRLAFDLGASLVLDNSNRTLVLDNGVLTFNGSSEVPLWTLEPELAVSWRQNFGSTFFIEPGIAGGGMFAFFHLTSSNSNVNDYNANDQTPYGRAFIRAGIFVPNGSAGIEGSYLTGGSLNFGNNITGHASEWYVGIYGALRF